MNDLVALHEYPWQHGRANDASQCQLWIPAISIICPHEINSHQPPAAAALPFSSGGRRAFTVLIIGRGLEFQPIRFPQTRVDFSAQIIVAKLITRLKFDFNYGNPAGESIEMSVGSVGVIKG